MKALVVFVAAALGFGGAGIARASDEAAPPRAEVEFDHPENFTDVKDRADPTDSGRDAILGNLRDFVVREAGKILPPGFHLRMVFTDIDLAGEFEPWRGPRFDSVRIVRSIYPPAFKFRYEITDSRGEVRKKGEESIRDLNFETREILDQSDSLRIEKGILRDWLRENLKGLR
jgi:hypothetical protein